jgi:RNA polymerase sigma-70 factor (ECF subfamily)
MRYLSRFARNREQAEDLLHDTFERAMSAGRHPDAAGMAPWLFTIATRQALSLLRRQRVLRFVGLDAAKALPGKSTLPEDDAVRLALRRISPDQAVAIVLALDAGFSRAEAAAMVGVGEETFKSRLARGRVQFAQEYERLGGRD